MVWAKSRKAPKQLGPYEVALKIAQGGMGAVYKARHRETGEVVAVKVIHPGSGSSPRLLKRFEREFRAASRLRHPNLVRGLDYGQQDDAYYLVMEYVAGESLGDRIEREGCLREEDAARLLVQAAEALQYVHDQGLIHRDVKPDNILLTRDGRAKVADLGLVKDLKCDFELTRPRCGLGTPNFTAPEQLREAKQAGPLCDVYALGATLYTAVTGQLPFSDRNALVMLQKKLENEYVPPRRYVPTLSQRMEQVIQRAMQAEPKMRPPSCRAFITELSDPRWNLEEQRLVPPIPSGGSKAGKRDRDRRITVRHPSNRPGSCQPIGGEKGVRWTAQVLNVSTTGVALAVPRRFEAGTVLSLQPHGNEAELPARLLVRVVHAKQESPRRWQLGCVFGHELSDADVSLLR